MEEQVCLQEAASIPKFRRHRGSADPGLDLMQRSTESRRKHFHHIAFKIVPIDGFRFHQRGQIIVNINRRLLVSQHNALDVKTDVEASTSNSSQISDEALI